jgi:Ca-activated chloride channel family protein
MNANLPRPHRERPGHGRSHLALAAGAASLLLSLIGAAPAEAAGLLVADGGWGGVLEIEEHAVAVTVNNGIATTRVTQVFRNTENRVVEALYTFPVPKAASVANFSMWIDGKEMVGEVVEKERARQIYDSYKQRGRDPGLLEQTDYKTFEMRIFPIAAGAEQRVEVTYHQELDVDADWATYVYPLATVSRGGLDQRTRGRFALSFDARSEIPITELSSPSHGGDFAIVRHGAHYQQASLEATGGDLNRDVVIAWKLSRARTGFDLVAARQEGEDGYFLLTLTLGEELAEADQGMDYVFVLDASGSMDQEGKLALSRDSLGAFVRELSPADRFEMMSFNVAPTTLFDRLEAATDATKGEAEDFLDSQRARGGTVLHPALETAYRYKDDDRALNVVILSDGMTEQRERSELVRLIGARPSGTRVFAIGVGNEVNRPLLEQLAEEAGGLAAFISPGDDFTRQARAFRRKLLRPSAANPAIEFSGGGVYDLEPTKLPDLFHGSPLRLYGRYREAGTTTLSLSATVGGERLARTVSIELPERAPGNPEIERMWAFKRVDRLLKQAERQGGKGEAVAEIVRLGEAYSIATEYTSFLVLENDAEYQRWTIDRKNALRFGRDREALRRVEEELEALREKARSDLGPEAAKAQPLDLPGLPAFPQQGQPVAATPPRPDGSAANSQRGWDVDLGGGAIDPLGLVLAAGLAGLAVARRRRGR